MPDCKKAEELLAHVQKFIKDQEINCGEAVYQNDDVILNAYEFIDECCKIVGYHKDEDE